MARRRRLLENPTRAYWLAGLAGTAVLLIGGIALASKGGGGGPSQCTSWTKVTGAAAAEKILVALGQMQNNPVNLNSVPPGVYYYNLNGQQIRFVNNMDGSLGNTYPDTPAGNTSIYTCAS